MELMQLSNKILCGFFGIIFIYLTAVFTEIRLTGTPNFIDADNGIDETVNIPSFTYLVLKDINKNINIVATERSQLEVRSVAGDLLKNFKYHVSNDTLTLSGLISEKIVAVTITLFVPKTGFKGMTVKKSDVTVKGLRQDRLHILQNAGRIWMSDCKLDKIQMNASSHSLLNISSTSLDTLSAALQESEVQLYSSPLKLLEGSMEQSSSIHLDDIGDIQLKKDKSSRLNSYQ
jgi:hypothetical protein